MAVVVALLGGGVVMLGGRGRTAAPVTHRVNGRLDLNTASEMELERLPGIGKEYARRIVANRPFARKDELVDRKIIPFGAYDKMRDHVVASGAGR